MGELEATGEVFSGAALAGRLEPETDAVAADGHSHETACLNCTTPLVGDYCHACGQRGHVHRTLTAFFHDLLHGVLHFEGKIWRTLPLLAWHPGKLTRRYIDGERARFVSPIALFLFSVFLMFAVVNWVGGPADVDAGQIQSGLKADVAQSEAAIRTLEAERARIVAARGDTGEIDAKLKAARDEAGLEKAIAKDGARGAVARISDDVPAWLAAPLTRAADKPALTLYKVQNNAYKYSWALIPLSLPFLWLLFPFSRRFRLYDHMVFVTYSLAFMTLLVIVASLLGAVGLAVLAGMTMILPPIHMYRQLKAAYGLSQFGALWRTVLLTLFAVITAGLFVILLFALGIF